MKAAKYTRSPRLSPLRYPGGKQLLAPYIASVIEENFLSGCVFYEPFAGGASVSLELLRLEYISNAVLIERDPLIYAFWWCIANQMDDLCAAVEAAPVDIETWRSLNPLRLVDDPLQSSYSMLQLGVAGLFFNRTNFSGVLGAGPIGGALQKSAYKIDCRFNKVALVQAIQALRPIAERVQVQFGDSLTWLKTVAKTLDSSSTFVYVDPPYYYQGKKLYRYFFSDDQHRDLAQSLTKASYSWLLSYDDAPFIRDIYRGSKLQPIYLDYRVKTSRLAQELAISNLEIPPPIYEGFTVADLLGSQTKSTQIA
jgi:DNA adenine methylase